MQVFHTHTCTLVHTCTGIALGYLHTCTWILALAYLPLDAFVQAQVWKCQCVSLSVSVEVSVFKGFSGRTLRSAFGKKEEKKGRRKDGERWSQLHAPWRGGPWMLHPGKPQRGERKKGEGEEKRRVE